MASLEACRRDDSDILPTHTLRGAAAAAQPWTATRCHRLLRPLLSYLAALRKEEAAMAAKGDTERFTTAAKRPATPDDLAGRKRVRYTYSLKGTRRRQEAASRTATKAAVTAAATTIETSVTPAKRHMKQKEKQKERMASRHVPPGEVVVPTPVLCRATKQKREPLLPSSPLAASPAATRVLPAHRNHDDSDWACLGRAAPGKRFQLYKSIFRAMEALLRATTAMTTAKKPSSLLEMCLRRVPHYVAICEDEERREAVERGATPPAASQIAFEVYNDLESLGHGAQGWAPLGVVVRSHAVRLLAAAGADHLLHAAFVRILVRLFRSRGAHVEAEGLLTALVQCDGDSVYPAPETADSVFSGRLESLRLFVEYARDTGRWSCLFQQLDDFVSHGRLPAAWLSTRAFHSVWERIVRVLSSRRSTGESQPGLRFAETAMARLLQEERRSRSSLSLPSSSSMSSSMSSSHHTLASVLGCLAAVAILQREAEAETEDEERGGQMPSQRRLAMLVDACLCVQRRRKRTLDARTMAKRYLLGLAWDLAVWGDSNSPEEATAWCRDLVDAAGPAQRRQLYDATVSLVAAVAQSCGRGAAATAAATRTDAKPARVYLEQLCGHVAGRSGFGGLDRMQADGAFLLANRTNDLRDLAYAESLGEKTAEAVAPCTAMDTASATATVRPRTTTPTALFAGYRWEEGISEWVVTRPESQPCSRSLRSLRAPVSEIGPVTLHKTPRPALTTTMSERHEEEEEEEEEEDEEEEEEGDDDDDDEISLAVDVNPKRMPLASADGNAQPRRQACKRAVLTVVLPMLKRPRLSVCLPARLLDGSDDELCL